MKKKVLQGFLKKTIARALALGMVLTGVCLMPTEASEVQATEVTSAARVKRFTLTGQR